MIKESQCMKDSDWKGCCCTCSNQVAIHGHPWNEGDMKAPISQVVGFGCRGTVDGSEDKIIFFDRQHGFCEMYNEKSTEGGE